MGTELRINVENEALNFWKTRAAQHGLSLEEEIGQLLNKAVSHSHVEERFTALRQKIRAQCGELPDSTALIRNERDA